MAESGKAKSVTELTRGVQSCANWCFWIAGLTLVNAGLSFSGSQSSFVVGTALGQVAAQATAGAGPIAKTVAIIFNLGIIGFFVAIGLCARRGHRWAFVVAFLAYGGDTLILLLAPAFLPIAFHAWALISLGAGWGAAGALRKARAAEAAGQPLTTEQAFMPAGSGTSPENVDRAAREMEEMVRLIYAPKHERQLADPKDYRVDRSFYDRKMREFEALGFRKLGDYELTDLKGTMHDPGCFLRAAATEDGSAMGLIYHFRPAKWWLGILVWFINRGGLKCFDFETEFSDGSFVSTSTATLAASAKLPPQIDALYLPRKTATAEVLAKHRERVVARLDAHPTLTVVPVRTLEECHAAQDRQDAIKAAFRKEIGGMTREELLAVADTPAKKEAAELLWARMQARKQEAAAVPPVLQG